MKFCLTRDRYDNIQKVLQILQSDKDLMCCKNHAAHIQANLKDTQPDEETPIIEVDEDILQDLLRLIGSGHLVPNQIFKGQEDQNA